MYNDLFRKIVFWTTCLVVIYTGYVAILEPLFKKPVIEENPSLSVPDISINQSFFERLDKLEDNEVELKDETQGTDNIFDKPFPNF